VSTRHDTRLDRPVERLTDNELLAACGTAEEPERRGFDDATQVRVLAHELVAARGRLGYYRALYAAFLPEGRRYMIENLADGDDGSGNVPGKLTFTSDDDEAEELADNDAVMVWTEELLLDALRQQLTLHDYFTDLLGELLAA